MTRAAPRVLFLSYTGLAEPLSRSQVVPYLRELALRGYPSCLVTFEKPEHIHAGRFEAWRRELAAEGIEWHWRRYHKQPAVPATLYDIVGGILLGWRLARRHRIRLVHARASIAGLMGWVVAGWRRVPLVFDVRGLNAEEYVDGSGWSRTSPRYLALRWLEARMCRGAAQLVVLTEWVRAYLAAGSYGGPVDEGKITVIPCCADLARFRFQPEARTRVRAELGLGDRLVIMYVGQAGTWYLLDEMAKFARAGRRVDPDARLVLVTPTEPEKVWPALERSGWTLDTARVVSAEPDEVPAYLSAADVALSFITPTLSKRSSSPTKIGEYLACGLPVVANAGVGDMEQLFDGRAIGALVHVFSDDAFLSAWREIAALRADVPGLQAHCRAAAEAVFDLGMGAAKYHHVYQRALKEVPDGVSGGARACGPGPAGEAALSALRR